MKTTGDPRQVVVATFGAASTALTAEVFAETDAISAMPASNYAAGKGVGDTLILVACPDEPCAEAEDVARRARDEGNIAIAIVLIGSTDAACDHVAARALRPHADILVTTSDQDFLDTLVRALQYPC